MTSPKCLTTTIKISKIILGIIFVISMAIANDINNAIKKDQPHNKHTYKY